jgi:signal transduction histidine kinase
VHGGTESRATRADVGAAVGAAAFLAIVSPLAEDTDRFSTPGLVLCAVAGLAFAIRRPYPRLTLLVVTAAVGAYILAGEPGGPIHAASFVAAVNLGARTPTRVWLPASLASVAVLGAAQWVSEGFGLSHLPLLALLVLLPRIAADAASARRLRQEAGEEHTRRRIAEERLRIAREVHDVVGHGLASIALRAGAAEHVADRDPDEARAALRAIRQVSKDSLAELGSLLGVLRGNGDAVERAPMPDLDAVPGLVARLREAGMPVELDVRGTATPVPDVVGAAGYRIVQEALTNVARHAGAGTRARVRLERAAGRVEVEVVDDGPGAVPPHCDGGGLTGMRERAAVLGGAFEAGPAPRGGFRVWASLPAVAP